MNINLELYRTFYTVAKTGSISATANIMYISQPAITTQIRRLEEELLSYNEEINNLKQYLNEYIKLKDKFYWKIRNKAKNK